MPDSVHNVNSYGAARRKLGICYVGLIVVISCLLLGLQAPVHWFGSTDISFAQFMVHILWFAFAYELLGLPFDFSGFLIERRFAKTEQSYASYALMWCKSTFKHGVLFVGSIFTFIFAAKCGGILGVTASSLLVCVFCIWKQAEIARFISDIQFDEPDARLNSNPLLDSNKSIRLISSRSLDRGFTGGVIGLPRSEFIVIPAEWLKSFSPHELQAEIMRRKTAVACGSRTRGLMGAVLFSAAGVALCASLTQVCYRLGLDSSAGVVSMSLLFTVWSFLGLLILPAVNQRGVIETDQGTIARGVSVDLLTQTIKKIDERMECETHRSETIQMVFHPIPTPGRRIEALDKHVSRGAWQIARYSIWLSLIGLGLLGRAVHCNAGRPDLWCMLPAD